MKKRFIATKAKIFNFKTLILLIILIISLILSFNIFLASSINTILGNNNIPTNLLNAGLNKNAFLLDILNPKDLLKIGLNYVFDTKEDTPIEKVKKIDEHENSSNPKIYLYNTHDNEDYKSSLIESYSIKYNVKIASYMFSEYLTDLGIENYVEASSTTDLYYINSTLYESTYDASRDLIKSIKNKYPNIDLLIDIHRDAVDKSSSTVEIDGTSYAKVLFVVGTDNPNYEKNLKKAEEINNLLDPKITRGIIKKSKEDGNGVYNQDLSENIILLELGGQENTIEEVDNTLQVLSKAILKYMGG